MPRQAALAALVLAAAGCAPRPAAVGGAGPAAEPGAEYRFLASPFPVTDSAGRALELAFLGGFNIPRPQLVDVDGDGDLDLLVQEYGGRLTLLARDGTTADGLPRFRHVTSRYAGLDVGEWSRFVDLDGDGRMDLLAEWPFSYIRAFRNVGPRGAPAYAPAPDTLRDDQGRAIFADRQNIAQAVDLDCDGLLDLFIGRITGTVIHYEAVERGAPLPRFRFITDRFENIEIVNSEFGSMHGANTMAFADYDGDGDLDLFWGDFFEQGLLLIENTGTCEAPSLRGEPVRFPRHEPLLTSGYNAPAFGDLDGDGRPDLVVGVLGGAFDPIATTIQNFHYLTRDAAGDWIRRTGQLVPAIDVGSESIPSLVDLDGDGDLDLLLANKIEPRERQTARIYHFENTGTARAPVFRLRGDLGITGTYHYAPAWGDLDGDGDPDLLLGSWKAQLAWYRNEGGGGPAPRLLLVDSAAITITRGSNTTPALGDLDGDADLDLLIGEASGTLNYYRNDGGPTAPRFTLVTDQYLGIDIGRRSAPVLADLDGDGDLDLLVGSDDQGLVRFWNLGTRTEPRFVRDPGLALDVPPISAPALGDVDGDGDLDLVVGTLSGGALFFENRRPAGRR